MKVNHVKLHYINLSKYDEVLRSGVIIELPFRIEEKERKLLLLCFLLPIHIIYSYNSNIRLWVQQTWIINPLAKGEN